MKKNYSLSEQDLTDLYRGSRERRTIGFLAKANPTSNPLGMKQLAIQIRTTPAESLIAPLKPLREQMRVAEYEVFEEMTQRFPRLKRLIAGIPELEGLIADAM